MSSNLHNPVGLDLLDRAPSGLDAKKHHREDDAWLLAVTQTLVQRLPPLQQRSLDLAPDADPTQPSTAIAGEAREKPNNGGAALDGNAALGDDAPASSPEVQNRLTTELSDHRLGRLELSVARGRDGLHIVINVADSRVKALIETEQAQLLESLRECGLSVFSVEIGSNLGSGTGLAQELVAQERAVARPRGSLGLRPANARARAYSPPTEEDGDETAERVDVTA
jgi:flagellar hook-length control protein FliK